MALADALNAAPVFPDNAQVVIAPTALHLLAVKDRLKRSDVEVAVQNVYATICAGGGATDGGDSPARERRWKEAKAGAWTGELTTDMVKDAGVHWTILGHSERRSVVSAESSELVGHKVRGPRACVVTLTRTCTL